MRTRDELRLMSLETLREEWQALTGRETNDSCHRRLVQRTLAEWELRTNEETTCAHCGETLNVNQHFGWRLLRRGYKPQSWCRRCRREQARKRGRPTQVEAAEL